MDKILVTFIDSRTDTEIHDCNCEMEEINIMYKENGGVVIRGDTYIIVKVVPCVNGHVTYRIYIKPHGIA